MSRFHNWPNYSGNFPEPALHLHFSSFLLWILGLETYKKDKDSVRNDQFSVLCYFNDALVTLCDLQHGSSIFWRSYQADNQFVLAHLGTNVSSLELGDDNPASFLNEGWRLPTKKTATTCIHSKYACDVSLLDPNAYPTDQIPVITKASRCVGPLPANLHCVGLIRASCQLVAHVLCDGLLSDC